MKPVYFGRSLAASALFLSLAALVVADTFSFPHILERDGIIVSIAWNVKGGQPVAPTPASVDPNFYEIQGRFSFYDNSEVFGNLQALIEGTPKTPTVYRVSAVPKTLNPTDIPNAFDVDMQPVGMELPACDVESKDPGGVEITFSTRKGIVVIGAPEADSGKGRLMAKKQKMWLQSNFRITLNGSVIPTPLTLDPITDVAQTGGDLDGDGVPDTVMKSSDITFTIPISDAAPYQQLFQGTLAGKPTIVPIKIEYLDDAGLPLIVVTQDVVVISVGLEAPFQPVSQQKSMQVTCRGANKMSVFFQR